MKCEICHNEFKDKSALSQHLKGHSISSKEYYDLFLNGEDDGICPTCSKPTKYYKSSITKEELFERCS